MDNNYIVANRNFNTLQDAKQYCNDCDFDYSMIVTESSKKENKVVIIEIKETKKGRPSTTNNAQELYKIIRRGKRDIKEYIQAGTDRTFIYNWYELIKKDCNKYSEANKTCKQMYYNFIVWWNKYDKLLFPEYH